MRVLTASLILLAWSACASSELGVDAAGDGDGDGGATADAPATVDSAPLPDSRPPGDAACELGTPDNCSDCGDTCANLGTTGSAVACEAGGCVFKCAGENYDVDGNPANGCEEADSPTGNHLAGGATDLGSLPCEDGDSAINVNGIMLSDDREHDPAIPGFQASRGSANDIWTLFASGGSLCQNDLNLTLNVSGSSNPGCYKLSAITTETTYTCVASSGSCAISNGLGSYNDNTTILFVVEKTCTAAVLTEKATYTVSGHL